MRQSGCPRAGIFGPETLKDRYARKGLDMDKVPSFAVITSLVVVGLAGCSSSSPRLGSRPMGCMGMAAKHSGHAPKPTEVEENPCHGEDSEEKPAITNTRCPIMKAEIDSATITHSLVRQYKGRKVAFCCPSCPRAWDKLDDVQKDAKLAAVGDKERNNRLKVAEKQQASRKWNGSGASYGDGK